MRPVIAVFVGALLAVATFQVSAIEISPLAKVFKPTEDRGALTLRNTSTTAKTYQVMVEEWTVENGERVEKPATDLQLVPSLITIPAGKTQIVRFIRTGGPVSDEKVYRLVVQQILHPEQAKQPGLHMLLRVGLTWIWRAPGLQPALSARWEGNTLVLRNDGTATAHVVDVDAAGKPIHRGMLDYILPGTEVRIDAPADARGSTVRLTVNGSQVELAAP